MWKLDHKKGWALKNWYYGIVVLGKTLESPLDSKEIKLEHPKGNQSWMFTARTDAEAEAPILLSPDTKSRFIRKDPNAGKDWGQEEKGATEDEMVRWHYRLNGHEFEQAPGNGEGQRSLVCCNLWGSRVAHDYSTEQQQQRDKYHMILLISNAVKFIETQSRIVGARGWERQVREWQFCGDKV